MGKMLSRTAPAECSLPPPPPREKSAAGGGLLDFPESTGGSRDFKNRQSKCQCLHSVGEAIDENNLILNSCSCSQALSMPAPVRSQNLDSEDQGFFLLLPRPRPITLNGMIPDGFDSSFCWFCRHTSARRPYESCKNM